MVSERSTNDFGANQVIDSPGQESQLQKQTQLKRKFYTLCYRLGVSVKCASDVWIGYNDVRKMCYLDGDQLHWLVCLLYLDSRSWIDLNHSTRPSLQGMLKSTNLEPHRFFDICRRHMITEAELHNVNEIERSYQVGVVLGIKFPLVFETVFDVNNDNFDSIRKFAWLLFCWARCQPFAKPDDLVHSFGLMLALHELLFKAALRAGLMDAIHPELESSSTEDVLYVLCDRFQANYNDAKDILVSGVELAIDEMVEHGSLQEPLLDYVKLNEKSLKYIYDRLLEGIDQIDEYNQINEDISTLSDTLDTCNGTDQTTIGNFLAIYENAKNGLDPVLCAGWESKMTTCLRSDYGDMADFENGRKLTVVIIWQLIITNEHFCELDKLLLDTMFTCAIYECSIRLINYWNKNPSGSMMHWEGHKVPAFYAYSVIQPVVRALINVGLSRDSATYLLGIEEALLERDIFFQNSLLWSHLENIETLPSSQVTNKRFSKFTSDIANFKRSREPAKTSLTLLLSKLYKLAGKRLDDLCCQQLGQRELTGRRCWFLMESILRRDIQFLQDRHLDQILMCVVYAICKAVGQPCSFQQIISAYRKMDGQMQTFKIVRMDTHGHFANIIEFYNKVFVIRYKAEICCFLREQITTGKDVACAYHMLDLPALPGFGCVQRKFLGSPLKFSPKYSPYLSPRRHDTHSPAALVAYKLTAEKSNHGEDELIDIAVAMEMPERTLLESRKRRSTSSDTIAEMDDKNSRPAKRERLNDSQPVKEADKPRVRKRCSEEANKDYSSVASNTRNSKRLRLTKFVVS